MYKSEVVKNLFEREIVLDNNCICFSDRLKIDADNQQQTTAIFSSKWKEASEYKELESLFSFQQEWFLRLYGFETEENLRNYLKTASLIIDTGCGLGYKAKWFADLAPHAIVIGVDISESIEAALKNYGDTKNLFFLQTDIADTGLKTGVVDFTVCDQVIMHTEVPEATFKHLTNVTKSDKEFACYVYRKKALPRELVDDYFRSATHNISEKDMWEFSEQLTHLGKILSDLRVEFESPDIPLLGIKGGKYDLQRFVYWNFLKCFWKEDWGFDLSKSTNFDWYAPSNAKRFSKEEFLNLVDENNMEVTFFHEEEACYSGRFKKNKE